MHSKASNTGFRGVKKVESGKLEVNIGDGTNGGKINLRRFDTVEQAAGVYARAKYCIQLNGIPEKLLAARGNGRER